MHRRLRWLAIILAAAVLAFLLVPSAAAQEKSLRWHRWDSDIVINADGTFTVRETFEIEFTSGTFTFGTRNIPIERYESIRDFGVFEGGVAYGESRGQAANTFYTTIDDGEYVVYWYYPPTSNDTRVFTLEYTVLGGLFISEELGDNLFWKAVGPEHAFPIESSVVTVKLPPGATVQTSTDEPAAFGPNATITVSDDQTQVTYQADYIPVNQYFEVGVYFDHGVVPAVIPSWEEEYIQEQAWDENVRPMLNLLLGAVGVFLLIGGPIGVYLLWLFAGRDPKIGPVPDYLSEPPSDLPPGLAGTLVDEKVDLQDIMSTVVDLARRGVIEMEEQEKSVFGLKVSKDFVFRRVSESTEDLREYEKLLIEEMFGRRTEIDLDDLREKFYTAIPKLQRKIYKAAVEEGFFPASPKAIRGRYMGVGIAALVIAFGAGVCSLTFADRAEAVLCPFVSLGIASIALIIASRVMPAKTRKGAEEAAKWNAFKDYLKNIDRYADLENVADQFDQYLPYSIAFGLERSWINKFSRVPSTPVPGWYIPIGYPVGSGRALTGGSRGSMTRAPGAGDLGDQVARSGPSLDGMSDGLFGGLDTMSTGLFSMLNSTSRAFTSVPKSSGSSGGFSSGGGFSGGFSSGGGGGGGGAGFG